MCMCFQDRNVDDRFGKRYNKLAFGSVNFVNHMNNPLDKIVKNIY